MKLLRPASLLALATCAAGAAVVAQAPQPAVPQPAVPPALPRLVVLCSVDQLAAWVLAEAMPFFPADGGFRRLQQGGVQFAHCAYQHACTETGPGHATIGTGAPAAVHGIVRNSWWSPGDGTSVYCAGHPQEALPGLPEGKNRGPGRLLVPTLAAAMRAQIPGCRTASVSWKDRSAILMGGPDADVAAWIEATTGNLVTNTVWCQEVPTWITRFNQAGSSQSGSSQAGSAEPRAIDAYFGVKWERTGPDAAYVGLVDDRSYELAHQNGSNAHTLPQLMTGGKPEAGAAYYNQLYYSPFGNSIVRQVAEACIDGMQLGADDVPDLLCVSFSSTDLVGHVFGPDSVEDRDTLLRFDRDLAGFLAALDAKVGAGAWTFFLTADHGVAPTPEWAKEHGLPAGRALLHTQARAAAEKAIAERFGPPPQGRRYCVHAGEYALVFDRAAIAEKRGELAADTAFDEACDVAATAVTGVKGIRIAYTTKSVLRDPPGDDPFRTALRAALHPDRAGDVQFVIEPYWLDGATPASHGTPHAYDREVVGYAYGNGIAAGVECDAVVTPGLGVVLFAARLGIAPPSGAVDAVPGGVLTRK